MKLEYALEVAENVKAQLAPHCSRIEIAGSIRRRRPEVKDIEVVLIPLAYGTGLFESGIASVINGWKKVKGELPCKYTQRILPSEDVCDIFIADLDNWANIFTIRTGSAAWVHSVLATRWAELGFKSEGGILHRYGKPCIVETERDLFKLLEMDWVGPEERQ